MMRSFVALFMFWLNYANVVTSFSSIEPSTVRRRPWLRTTSTTATNDITTSSHSRSSSSSSMVAMSSLKDSIYLYNTLSREKEIFKPIQPEKVSFYR